MVVASSIFGTMCAINTVFGSSDRGCTRQSRRSGRPVLMLGSPYASSFQGSRTPKYESRHKNIRLGSASKVLLDSREGSRHASRGGMAAIPSSQGSESLQLAAHGE